MGTTPFPPSAFFSFKEDVSGVSLLVRKRGGIFSKMFFFSFFFLTLYTFSTFVTQHKMAKQKTLAHHKREKPCTRNAMLMGESVENIQSRTHCPSWRKKEHGRRKRKTNRDQKEETLAHDEKKKKRRPKTKSQGRKRH